MGNELILIANALNQIANELAEIKYILKYSNNETHHESVEKGYGQTESDPCTTHGHRYTETVNYGEFKRRVTQ